MDRKISSVKRTFAFAVAACMAAQPAFAGPTEIAAVPLASSAGTSFLPNLLFTLDDSGSMARDFLPDYVNDTNTCMVSDDGTACQRGDPPYEAGGQFGFNGVGYDPNFYYAPGLSSSGATVLAAPLSTTALTPDAYLGGTNVNITTNSPDNRYCNGTGAGAVCKRNGADSAGTVLPAGKVDAEGHTLGAGQFPYRTNASSASIIVGFGLPEMMPIGTFTRSGTTVTVGTITPHGLTTSDKIFVTGTSSLNVTCVAVTNVTGPNAPPASPYTFTYSTSTSGTIAATTGRYRKCGPATFERASNIVTATVPTGHFVVTGDIISTFVASGSPMNVTNATITVTSPTTLTYTTGTSSGTIAPTAGFGVRTGLYNVRTPVIGPPAAYRITPVEYCTDANLTNCIEVIPPAVPPASHPFPAYVRFCRSQAEALAPGAVTAIATTPPTPRCQLKFVSVSTLQTYLFPRLGWFTRDTITSSVASYGNRPNRSDCAAAPSCTYDEEMQNYARWYTYYRTRMQMMKTAAGRAFLSFISNPTASPPKPDRLRVGFITINPGSPVSSSKYLRINNFSTTSPTDQAQNFYTKFYSQVSSGGTPLREALSRAGWIFAGKFGSGLTGGIPGTDDPMQASCQKNYSILTTDGFWNGNAGQKIDTSAIGNQDNVDNQVIAPYTNFMVSRSSGTYDGNLLSGTTAGSSPGGSGTLADVALYYYKTDLRPTGSTSPSTTPANGDVATNNVLARTGDKDFVTHQHMTTFTLGLIDGLMRYQPDYETSTTGDFANIKNGAAAAGNCFWSTGTCNWPSPQQDNQTALDDLWHAAANGRGTFYSALNPNALATGLANALNNLDTTIASAAAAATSSPQLTQDNNQIFSTTYQTNTWSGRVFAQSLDPLTATVLPGTLWQAHPQLFDKAQLDQRNIWMLDTSSLDNVKPFQWVDLNAGEQAFFSGKCVSPFSLSHCATLSLGDQIVASGGDKMVAFLRGRTSIGPLILEGTLYRDRTETDPATGTAIETVLGDIINAQPVFVRPPFFEYTDPGYSAFKLAKATRAGTLYVGANDGYLHAFNGATGEENWAYAPKFVMPAMYQLADKNYGAAHRFFVDGSPETADVCASACTSASAVWKTLLVGGANSGGRGFYALDITDPAKPKGLWEFCSDPALCSVSDPDLGLSYGNPVIGKRPPPPISDGRWVVVVTSGLNNITPGTGEGFFYVLDAITGAILHKVGIGVGDTTNPAGLMKMGAYYPDGLLDATFTHVYGGDQFGRVWRVNMSASMVPYSIPTSITRGAPVVLHLATLKDAAGRIQPLTARPAGTPIKSPTNVTYRVYYVGTGRYLGNSDLSDPGLASGFAWQQSIYAIKDKFPDNATVGYGDIRTGATLVKQTLSSLSPTVRSITKNPVNWDVQDGFVIDLEVPLDPSPGERVVLDVRLIFGTLLVTSTVPATGGCTPGGNSFQYQLDYKTGGYVKGAIDGAAGFNMGSFLVGAAVVQTTDGTIKSLNKDYTGGNTPISINIDRDPTKLQRFSYRER